MEYSSGQAHRAGRRVDGRAHAVPLGGGVRSRRIIENMDQVIEDGRLARAPGTWRDRYDPMDESLPSSAARSVNTWKTADTDNTERIQDYQAQFEFEDNNDNSNETYKTRDQDMEHLGPQMANNTVSAGTADPAPNLQVGARNSLEQGLGKPNSTNKETEADASARGVGPHP